VTTNRSPDFRQFLISGAMMQLTRPRFSTFLVSLILAVLVIASFYTQIPAIGADARSGDSVSSGKLAKNARRA
jgi:hypothetical protein